MPGTVNTANIHEADAERRIISFELLDALRGGDHNAFATVFLHYHKRFENFLAKLTGSAVAAEEICQEVFKKLWEVHATIDPSGNVKSYLFSMARNAAFNYLKTKKGQTVGISDYEYMLDSSVTPDQMMIARDTQLLIEVAVKNMPSQRQKVYKMYLEERSPEDIAAQLHMTRASVHTHITRARNDIRELIGLITFFALID